MYSNYLPQLDKNIKSQNWYVNEFESKIKTRLFDNPAKNILTKNFKDYKIILSFRGRS